MDFEARYRALLQAFRTHAELHGCELTLRRPPDCTGHPFEFAFKPQQPANCGEGTLFLFAVEEICLTSQLLAVLTRGVARTEEFGGPSVLLFCEENVGALTNMLHATGLAGHSQVATYSIEREPAFPGPGRTIGYHFNWIPGQITPGQPLPGGGSLRAQA